MPVFIAVIFRCIQAPKLVCYFSLHFFLHILLDDTSYKVKGKLLQNTSIVMLCAMVVFFCCSVWYVALTNQLYPLKLENSYRNLVLSDAVPYNRSLWIQILSVWLLINRPMRIVNTIVTLKKHNTLSVLPKGCMFPFNCNWYFNWHLWAKGNHIICWLCPSTCQVRWKYTQRNMNTARNIAWTVGIYERKSKCL